MVLSSAQSRGSFMTRMGPSMRREVVGSEGLMGWGRGLAHWAYRSRYCFPKGQISGCAQRMSAAVMTVRKP